MTEITKQEIARILNQHYSNKSGGSERNLLCVSHTGDGSFDMFFLDGTPPKGYALYIHEGGKINFYDYRGRRFKIFDSMKVV